MKMEMDLYKKYSNCRKCGHPFAFHCLYVNLSQGDSILDVIAVIDFVPCGSFSNSDPTNNFGSISCGCDEFVPSDNLDYLEWKYEIKNKKKRKTNV